MCSFLSDCNNNCLFFTRSGIILPVFRIYSLGMKQTASYRATCKKWQQLKYVNIITTPGCLEGEVFSPNPISLTFLLADGRLLTAFCELRHSRSQTRMSEPDNVNHRVIQGQMANQLTFMTTHLLFNFFAIFLPVMNFNFWVGKAIKKR